MSAGSSDRPSFDAMRDPSALRLVVMTDNLRDGVAGLVLRAQAACRGGATMLHLRLPDEEPRIVTSAARALASSIPIPVVVHGRIDIALATGARGVHLGVRDIPPDEARRLAGDDFIVGKSLGRDEEDASLTGIDYVTVGPIFPLAERRGGDVLGVERLASIVKTVRVPVVAIGGISAQSAPSVLRAGATGVALISGIFGARDPEAATRAVRAAIET